MRIIVSRAAIFASAILAPLVGSAVASSTLLKLWPVPTGTPAPNGGLGHQSHFLFPLAAVLGSGFAVWFDDDPWNQ
jgi:hypothetical protein